jgi:hypothetical protein
MNIPINTRLVTKDGFKVGNALCTGYIVGTNPKDVSTTMRFFKVKTDYGNEMTLAYWEVTELFHFNGLADETHKHFVPSIS